MFDLNCEIFLHGTYLFDMFVFFFFFLLMANWMNFENKKSIYSIVFILYLGVSLME